MIALVLALAFAGGLALGQAGGPTVSLSEADAVKAAYAAANYDATLQQIGAMDPSHVTPQLEQYRALSLLALGRSDEAAQAFERLVRQAPAYRLTDADVSPRIAAMFREVRQRVLPSVAREMYARGKSSFDQKRFVEAAAALRELLAVLDDPDLDARTSGMDDLKQLADGFIRLADAEVTLAARAAVPATPAPAAAMAPPPPPPDPNAAVVTKIVVYSAADTQVRPPVEIERRMPPWAPPPVIARSNAEYRGELEIVVNEIGQVESAAMRRPSAPAYDLTLLEAARHWRFRAATLDNQPVKYRLTYDVALTTGR
jgi:tetratricopeptide (TPR) repeat protein